MAISTVGPNPITGSWFNSGFHGHFRNKSRSDFICEYRQLAKPQPPTKFNRRTQENPARHLFSRHDNRHSFLSDALYFEEGLGRKRIPTNNFAYNRDMLTWQPLLEEFKKTGPGLTEYQYTYRSNPAYPVQQILINPPRSSFDHDTSTYRYTHGKDNPNRELLNAMTNKALTSTYSKKQGLRSGMGRESVASCLSWYEPEPRKTQVVQLPMQDVIARKPTVPAATETCVYIPHPPAVPKPPPHTHVQQVSGGSDPAPSAPETTLSGETAHAQACAE